MVRSALEGESGRRAVLGHHREVVGLVRHRQPQELCVEGGQCRGVGAVQDDVVGPTDHRAGTS